MGASNALAAFRLYAGKVPPTALNVLTYMALVALDRDEEPRYWEGHEALAVHCLGRDEAAIDDSDLRAVRRAITALFDAGAVTVVRRSSGRREKNLTAQYRLHLVKPAPDEKRPTETAPMRPSPDGNRPTSEVITGRKVTDHRTESDRSPDGNRPPEEEEDHKERDKTSEEYSLPSSDSAPVGAREVPDEAHEMACRYSGCQKRPAPIDSDGFHENCRYLAKVKGEIRASPSQDHPEAS